MHWGYNWQSGWFFGMHLLWWVFWIAIVAVCVWAFTRGIGPGSAGGGEASLEVLRRRYAEGAITTAEYEERRARLLESA
jgi:putative membrane protein